MAKIDKWSLVVAVKDEAVFENTLLKSPDIDGRCEIIKQCDYRSASEAYRDGASQASNELLVFAHTDVYLPKGWLGNLGKILEKLAEVEPNWGVLGVYGIARKGEPAGHVYSTGLMSLLGQPFEGVIETVSLDELLLITRKSAGQLFDQNLPGFHLYGTDVCLEARRKGMKSYIISNFCIHNSVGMRYLPFAFWRSYLFMRTKWWKQLPVRTCCTTISKSWWPVMSSLRTTLDRFLSPSKIGTRSPDVELLYHKLSLTEAAVRVVSYND